MTNQSDNTLDKPSQPAGDVVLRSQAEIRIYRNQHGDLVILQNNYPDPDAVIVVNSQNVNAFLDEITDRCGIPSFGRD